MSKAESLTTQTQSLPEPLKRKTDSSTKTTNNSSSSGGEKNRTDPKVCHDPSQKMEGIARLHPDQNKYNMEDGELSTINEYDTLKIDGIEYPLVVINDRNVENHEILQMTISYNSFLPKIYIQVYDEQESEQKIYTSQMSGLIKVAMVSPVDKIYRKILLNFRILNASVNENNRKIISYFGEYYVEGFRDVKTMLIWMESVCPAQPNCGQGGHINANTWEMLHKIAELSGLGFAATKKCKEIPDHIVRHIHTQRLNEYIEQQLVYCGTDVDNIFDAWVDLYGYIVMVNVPWVFNEEIVPDDLTITANIGVHPTSNDIKDQEPKDSNRTLTNYNMIGTKSNLEIESYNIEVKNDSVDFGTLERIYPINLMDGGRFSKIDLLDIQTKQNSIDGEHIEDYNTGKRRPIPKFDFNNDAYTEKSNGYDMNTQKRIRTAYFKKIRQSTLNVKLKTINFGLQRGTLVNVAIYDNDFRNKDFMLKNTSRVTSKNTDVHEDQPGLPVEVNQDDLVRDDNAYLPNFKLSGLYYVDGMKFEYTPGTGKIDQILILIKKGITSGYMNRHNGLGVPLDKYGNKQTLSQTKLLEEQDKV